MEKAHALDQDEVISRLETDRLSGLDSEEAGERLARHGYNELPKEKKPSILFLFLKQFHSRLIYILFIAAAIAFAAGQHKDAYGILLAVLIDAVFSFVQERRAEDAIERLREMVVQEASVVRGGKVHRIPAREIVPGDIVLLEEGDRIVADARILESKDLRTAEASLTGESSAVQKSPEQVAEETLLPDRTDMVWMGTNVVAGVARVAVVETGERTAFGGISRSLREIKQEKAPLETRLDVLGQKLGLFTIGLAVIVLVLGWLRGTPLFEMFLFAVAMVVAVIPEGLPAVLAVVLAIGVRQMAKRNAIIRHVPSVETLGVADVICTDKTGTITENKMTVREIHTFDQDIRLTGEGWEPRGEFLIGERKIRPTETLTANKLLKVAALCTKASLVWRNERPGIIGDPTEGALIVMAAKAGLDKQELQKEYRLIDEIPFNSTRKFRAILFESIDDDGGKVRELFVVGAYEVLKERATALLTDRGSTVADRENLGHFDAQNDAMADRARRVLGAAFRRLPDEVTGISDSDVSDLTMLGLVGMIDPPRRGVDKAIARCRSAGVRVIMLTGDQLGTAVAIGKEVGLFDGEDAAGQVFTEVEVVEADDTSFRDMLSRAAIFARVSPETKLRIVGEFQKQGRTVAMTGDGVNDAPALKKASIGISMGIIGTDVSKEVSDMVLADDNFISIVNAIEEGRIVFRNIKQTVAYLFMTNMGEVTTVLASILMGLPLPLLPAQILWMNLVTDGFPDIALATEREHGEILDEPPRRPDTPIISKNVLILTALVSVFMCVGTLSLFVWALRTGDVAYARTIAFTTMAVFQLWNVFNMRSARTSIFRLGLTSNLYVLASVVASLLLQLAVLYLPLLQTVFRTMPLGLTDWILITAVTSTVFFAVEFYKYLYRRGVVPASWA